MEGIEDVLEAEAAVEVGEGAGVLLEDDDFLRAELAEVLHFLLELVDLEIVVLVLPLQELCEFLLLLLRVCVLEGDASHEVVVRGVCPPLVDGELLREQVARSGRFSLTVER